MRDRLMFAHSRLAAITNVGMLSAVNPCMCGGRLQTVNCH